MDSDWLFLLVLGWLFQADFNNNPDLGINPRYLVLKRQGYKVLVLEKDLVFYKVNEAQKEVIIYAVVDQRQDYLNIIRGL